MTNGPDQKRKALGRGLSALLPNRLSSSVEGVVTTPGKSDCSASGHDSGKSDAAEDGVRSGEDRRAGSIHSSERNYPTTDRKEAGGQI